MSTLNLAIQRPFSYRFDPIIARYPALEQGFSFAPALRKSTLRGSSEHPRPLISRRKLRGFYRRMVGSVADTLHVV